MIARRRSEQLAFGLDPRYPLFRSDCRRTLQVFFLQNHERHIEDTSTILAGKCFSQPVTVSLPCARASSTSVTVTLPAGQAQHHGCSGSEV